MVYEPRDEDEVRSPMEEGLEERIDDPALGERDVLGAIVHAVAETIAGQQEQSLEEVARNATLVHAEGDALDDKAAEIGIERREAVRATGVLEFYRNEEASTDYVIPRGTEARTDDGTATFETTERVTLEEGDMTVKANARAVRGGTHGNLPANRLIEMPSPPTGVEAVTNPEPTGDPEYTDTDGNSLTVGESRESDDELRERALASTSIGGAATPNAVETALRDTANVRTVTIFTNPYDSEDEDGLPPYSSEVIVSGGTDQDVADTLVDTVAVTDLMRLQSGVNGEGVTVSRHISSLDQDVAVDFSRPEEINLVIEAEVSTNGDYAGEDAIADQLVDYIGGQNSDGDVIVGLGASEDVYIGRIEDAIIGSETGVNGIADLTVDATGDGSDDRTTDDDGIEIIEIGGAEQAMLDAEDVTITTV